jgi:crotonobetainyl-CoA:carnitine CoA-transferase CaiB-like acyl-CoA transferase
MARALENIRVLDFGRFVAGPFCASLLRELGAEVIKLKVPGSVFKLSQTPGDAASPAPFLGQHNYEVYSGLLGYNEPEIRQLQDDGVI